MFGVEVACWDEEGSEVDEEAKVGGFCVGLSGEGAKAGELPAVGVCGGLGFDVGLRR